MHVTLVHGCFNLLVELVSMIKRVRFCLKVQLTSSSKHEPFAPSDNDVMKASSYRDCFLYYTCELNSPGKNVNNMPYCRYLINCILCFTCFITQNIERAFLTSSIILISFTNHIIRGKHKTQIENNTAPAPQSSHGPTSSRKHT
jgi:hypothetical protein